MQSSRSRRRVPISTEGPPSRGQLPQGCWNLLLQIIADIVGSSSVGRGPSLEDLRPSRTQTKRFSQTETASQGKPVRKQTWCDASPARIARNYHDEHVAPSSRTTKRNGTRASASARSTSSRKPAARNGDGKERGAQRRRDDESWSIINMFMMDIALGVV